MFAGLVAALVVALSSLLSPSFVEKREDCAHKVYDQPANTIEVAVVGASTLLVGVSPDLLFENHGIAAYNACSSDQPVLSSRYLLKTLMANQGSTLKTVIVDASPLLSDESESDIAGRATALFSDMRPSAEKLEYLADMRSSLGNVSLRNELLPLLKYHSRWDELTPKDFGIASFPVQGNYSHGQLIWSRSYQSNAAQGRAGKFTDGKSMQITEERSFPESTLRAQWNDLNVEQFRQLVSYCAAENLDVLLLRLPASEWGDLQHDSAQLVAEECGVPFLDMAKPEIASLCQVSYDLDYYDGKHPTLAGSEKLTSYLGDYLAAHNDYADARHDPRYGFMAADLEAFHHALAAARLAECADLESYLDLIGSGAYSVFITASSDAAPSLSDAVRSKLANLGLPQLAGMGQHSYYAGAISSGAVLVERTSTDKAAQVFGSFRNGAGTVQDNSFQRGAAVANSFALSSGPNGASVVVRQETLCESNSGITFVVYSPESGILVDKASFDTTNEAKRTGGLASESAG